jgi:hypothetical protein
LEELKDTPIIKQEHKQKLILNNDIPKEKEDKKKEINKSNEDKEFFEIKKTAINLNEEDINKNIFVELKIIGQNLQELMLDMDKKLYYNVELKEKVEKMEESIKELINMIEEVFFTEDKAILYYLKKNKGKPIKLKELYRRFNKKLVNKIITELYEKGFIKILE